MKKMILPVLFCLFAFNSLQAQYTIENQFSMPLKEVFRAMEEKYGVQIVCPANLSEGKSVKYGLYQFKPDFLQTLDIVLSKFDLDYTVDPDGAYRIKTFEYARRRPQEGADRLNGLMAEYDTLEEWEARKAELKNCLYHTLGLAPIRDKLVLRMTTTPRRKMDGYTVENFALETLPGVYATGSVYRPLRTKRGEKWAFILNPNGHFPTGRYYKDIQTRCAMMARMGAIAVDIDLFGYGESLLAFTPEDHRNSMALTMHSLQNMALLDYFLSQPDIDPQRVGVTGASGGGSQTMVLTALDERVAVSAPVVMVSSYFMGGCGCESGLPIGWCGGGTNLAEIAAMAAPRPMLVVSDGKDWTMQVDRVEYPFIQRTYGFYGAEKKVQNLHLAEEGHDFGPSKRQAVYAFLAAELGLNAAAAQDKEGNWDESKVTVEPETALKVFGPAGERFPADAVRGIENLYRLVESYR